MLFRRLVGHRRLVCQTPSIRCLAVPSDDAQRVLQDIVQLQAQAVVRAPRFYMPDLQLSNSTQGFEVALDGEEGKHAVKVLRLKEGDQVQLCDGKGTLVQCALTAVDKGRNKAWLESVAAPVMTSWQGPRWCLAVACTTLKGGRAEWLVEKATELGAAELIPVITARSQPQGPGKNKYKKADEETAGEYSAGRLERVAVAATKQCLRTHMLQLHSPQTVQQVAQLLQQSREAYLAVAGAPPLVKVMNKQAKVTTGVQGAAQCLQPRFLLVGPEGDWTPEELHMLVGAGAEPVGLGDLRLRTETAAIALLSAATMLTAAATDT